MSTQGPPDTSGDPYIWPEEEEVDESQICNNCDHTNEPGTIHCEECDTFLLEYGADDDTPASDPDEALGEDVGAKTFESEEELYESLEAGLDNAVIGLYMTVKEGIKIMIRSMERMMVLFGLMFIGSHSAAFLGFHTLFGVTAGVIWGILTFGYLTRHENTVVSQMV